MKIGIKNKRGIMGILLVVGLLFILVLFGILMAIGSSTINYVMDTVVPELDLGQIDNTNTTDIVRVVINPVNEVIQNFTWLAGVVYLFGMMGIFGLAFTYKGTGDKWLIGLFFGLVLILVIGCIFMSNIYEELYDGGDAIGTRLHEHVILSHMILYSPAIMTLIAFVAGIILFSGAVGGGRA